MKKTTLVLLIVALAVLLGLAVYMTVAIFWGPGGGLFCPFCPAGQQRFQDSIGGRMGPGMMGRHRGVIVNSEYEFLVHMIPHHEEAVYTAGILMENTEREEMKNFADEIIRTQNEEIELMISWLEAWYPEKDHDIDYRPMMRNLENLEGEELDRIFLEDMIFHHMEAVMMSQQLLSRGLAEHEEVYALARNIRNTQREEIIMMRSWLARW